MATPLQDNLAAAETLLARFRNATLPHYINGRPVAGSSGQSFDNLTPIDNSVIGKVSAGNAEDIDAACTAAQAAFPAWRDMPGEERKVLLHRIADGHPDNAFIHLSLRIAHGRSLEVRKAAGDLLFETFCRTLQPLVDRRPLALSFEISEIDPVLNYKGGNIREYMAKRGTA